MRLTSLLLVEERLLEAEHFCARMRRARGAERFGYELNAFLSAARSTTFLMQKEMSRIPGFRDWWELRRRALGRDDAAAFFLRLRNFSQKEGRVSIVGLREGPRRWTFQFAGGTDPPPGAVLHRDVVDCCREHLAKLANVALDCVDAFPYWSCPRWALTPEGVTALGLTATDIAAAAGLPEAWIDAGQTIPEIERLRTLRNAVDGLDLEAVRRLSKFRPRTVRSPANPSAVLGASLLASLVNRMEGGRLDRAGLVLDLLASEGPDPSKT